MNERTGVLVTGVGMAVPDLCLTNAQMAQLVDTTDAWIETRTGIRERRVLAPGQKVMDLAVAAGEKALAHAGITAADIDLVILATSTADDLFGSASRLAHCLGANRAVGFDLTAACTGFVFAVATATQFLQNGVYQKALVIAADGLTRHMDWQDRSSCVLFGDGAGAVVLERGEAQGILGFELRSGGYGAGMLTLEAEEEALTLHESLTVSLHHHKPIKMNGREVYRFAVTEVPTVIEKALHRAAIEPSAVDYYILHQANQRILDAVAERLKISHERLPSTLGNYANTSAASIPITLSVWAEKGLLTPGKILVFAGFGAGLTWGAMVCRWGRFTS
jgi:3-oxoacyl-[acyl-carrier-protein] synthase III